MAEDEHHEQDDHGLIELSDTEDGIAEDTTHHEMTIMCAAAQMFRFRFAVSVCCT